MRRDAVALINVDPEPSTLEATLAKMTELAQVDYDVFNFNYGPSTTADVKSESRACLLSIVREYAIKSDALFSGHRFLPKFCPCGVTTRGQH